VTGGGRKGRTERWGLEQVPRLYDPFMALFERGPFGRLRSWLAHGASGKTLDLGCGSGRTLPLLPEGVRAVGLDPDLKPLLAAREKAPSVPLVLGRAEALPFRRGTFETVLSGLAFCSVDDVPRGLAEARRVLAPRGTLRMLEHVRPPGLLGPLSDLLQPIWTAAAGGCRPNRRTPESVGAAGFSEVRELEPAEGIFRRIVATR
jgi:SAM-dependent methyltransferase